MLKYFTKHGKKLLNFSEIILFLLLSEAWYKLKYGNGLKMLTPKKLLHILPIALPEVKASKTSEKLLNEISQIMYSLNWAKEITKKYSNNAFNKVIKQNGYYIYEF